MPRLLLVDDNPSIHKIAETLLSTTSIELVCVESGSEALRRVEGGELFDVALVDTAMIGMDGWTLLARLREIPATARIPIAMMAGVLDSVDPGRLESAPIQGFLKKPVELRELGDRIEKLLATPVPETGATDPSATATLDLALPPDDLLVLEVDDLWEEAPQAPAAAPLSGVVEEESLELEELDLESLREVPEEAIRVHSVLEELPSIEALTVEEPLVSEPMENPWAQDAWEKTPVAPLASREEEPFLVTADELPDLGELVAAAEAPTVTLEAAPPPAGPAAELHPESDLDLSLDEELDLPPAPAQAETAPESPFEPGPALAAGAVGLAVAAGVTAFAFHETSAPVAAEAPAQPTAPEPVPAAPGPASHPLVDAILQDPAAMEALTRALAARLGDKALRELAWEVMPELADRLKR